LPRYAGGLKDENRVCVQRVGLAHGQVDPINQTLRTKGDCGMSDDTNPTHPLAQSACGDSDFLLALPAVTRVVFVASDLFSERWHQRDVQISIQDGGRTLKVWCSGD